MDTTMVERRHCDRQKFHASETAQSRSPVMDAAPKLTIRYRSRRGYSREAGGYAAWNEYQVVRGRKVIARFDLLEQATRAYPDAIVDESAK